MAGVFSKHRFQIWNQNQHPYRHPASDFNYSNPALPGVISVTNALDWAFKVLYPNNMPAVATPAALPAGGNTINDYRVVLDDGDGKQAGYRWEQREGDVAAKWYKIYDWDWSTDSILSAFLDVTQDEYVHKAGRADRDDTGTVITGLYAGQKVYGGSTINQNFTLAANSGDGTGAHTGYVQVDDNFRPTVNNTYDLGTTTEKFKTGYIATSLLVATLTFSTGLIVDSTGTISFNDENLTTTGTITGAIGLYTSRVEVGPLVGSALVLAPGSITDESGAIDFGNENLATTGTVAGATGSTFGNLTLANGSITSGSGAISFNDENLSTTGTLSAGDSTLANISGTRLDIDNLRLDANTLSSTNANGNITITPNGSGVVDITKAMTTVGQTVTGTLAVTGQLNIDNLRLDGNTLSSTDASGNIVLSPQGAGLVQVTSNIVPSADGTLDLGGTSTRFNSLFLDNSISDGTNSIAVADLLSLRDINVGVGAGYAIFYNGSKWVSSLPDTEVDHGTLTGLGDDDHAQYALLAGRSGGQTLQGDTASGGHLLLDSTAHASKGFIKVKSSLVPNTTAAYSAGWSGTDLGGTSNYFNDVYTKGEFKGFRFELYTSGTLPGSSAQNVGRAVYATDNKKIYIDDGSSFQVAGSSKFSSDTSWNGTDVTKDVTVSSTIQDAREAIWQLCDNANDFERIFCSIKAISSSVVRIAVSPALPSGSYRLLGIQ